MDFSHVLLTVDFDRTMTGPDSTVPQRNLDAIRWFIANGGAFTLNTGRSVGTLGTLADTIPVSAPFLLYNGSASLDPVTRELRNLRPIDLPLWETLEQVHRAFPHLNLELQGADTHYLYDCPKSYEDLYHRMGWGFQTAVPGSDVGPFLKFALFAQSPDPALLWLSGGAEEEIRQVDEAERWLRQRYGDKLVTFRSSARLIDVQAKGVSKLAAARQLQQELGRKILVCVGDSLNDITMLDGADYAYCPGDAVVADRYETVCNCADGAVADVIYEKIPEILRLCP